MDTPPQWGLTHPGEYVGDDSCEDVAVGDKVHYREHQNIQQQQVPEMPVKQDGVKWVARVWMGTQIENYAAWLREKFQEK